MTVCVVLVFMVCCVCCVCCWLQHHTVVSSEECLSSLILSFDTEETKSRWMLAETSGDCAAILPGSPSCDHSQQQPQPTASEELLELAAINRDTLRLEVRG